MPSRVYSEAIVSLPFSPEELWTYVADTDRLDKSVGLPPANFTRGDAGKGEVDTGEYRLAGIPIARWVENPFQWERPRRFSVVRDYKSGPIVRFRGGTELEPAGQGTNVRVFAEFLTKVWAVPLVRGVVAPLSIKRSSRQFQAIGDFLARKAAIPFPQLVENRTPANKERLEALMRQLRRDRPDSQAAALLGDLLANAPDEDVASMRPLDIGQQHGLDPGDMLETFLQATVIGLLEMRWEMLCPGCRGVKAEAGHLRDLQETAYCPACNLEFRADSDDLIEARFYPAASVRKFEVNSYCVSGPAKTPNRYMQLVLEPGQRAERIVRLQPGPYVLRTPQTRAGLSLQVEEQGDSRVEVAFEALSAQPESASAGQGDVTFALTNETRLQLTVALDQPHTPPNAATPGRLMTFPAFQSLFSAEALAPGIELQVSRVGLLFTDLAGSTALYERVGDARAFRLVTDHFAILRRAIEEAGGAVIKSIGDAIMAAFPDGETALEAALHIQEYILELDPRDAVEPGRLVKVGVHEGACFAVTQNERLDYFGTTVNVAARAQHEARGGEIVCTADAFEGRQQLVGAGYEVQPFAVELKGISGAYPLVRLVKRPVA